MQKELQFLEEQDSKSNPCSWQQVEAFRKEYPVHEAALQRP